MTLTPDSQLDLLFPTELVPLNVRMALHSDLHVRPSIHYYFLWLTKGGAFSELSRFIASGRLHCTIDKVEGVVETNRPAVKNAQYETVVRQGDVLLNSVQRLSKVLY